MKLPVNPNSQPQAKSRSGFTLPTQKSEPIDTIEKAIMLLYGERKIGKTSLASRFTDAFFLMFEPGGSGLSIYQQDIADWNMFCEFVDLLQEQTDFYRTIVIDTIDIAYEKCMEYVCKREGFGHPSDKEVGFGKGWKLVDTEFKKQMTRLLQTGRGTVFVSHAHTKEFQAMSGPKFDKLVPTMGTQAARYIIGLADILAYYGYYGEERFLTIRGSDSVECGHRLRENFWVEDRSERVHSIPMGKDEDEAYANFMLAFNNKQQTNGKPEDETGMKERAVKMGK